jgi:hypothetical protein
LSIHHIRKVTSVDELTARALVAFVRSDGPAHVSDHRSGQVHIEDETYVVLRNNRGGLLAVYRYRPSGMLRRLKRWPKAIETMEGGR